MESIATIADLRTQEAAYARFLPRLRALIIDSIVLTVVLFAALIVAVAIRADSFVRPLGFTVAAFWLLYEPLFVAYAGGTLGHIKSNLRVVDDRTLGNVSLLKAIARSLIKGVLGWLSFVTMLTTLRSQAIHDLMTRSTVQIRDIGKAGPKQFVRKRTELDSAALPSWKRRSLVIVVYMAAVLALCIAILFALTDNGFYSQACLDLDRCSRLEEASFSALAGTGLIGSVAMVVLGWRGHLLGARRAP